MTQQSNRIQAIFGAALVSAAMFTTNVNAQAALERHNPYTVDGMQLRANLITPSLDVSAQEWSGAPATSTIVPTLFQEIVPCRFISTLEADHYPQPWGGGAFQPNERRTYKPTGTLVEGLFTNPCSDKIPTTAIGVSLRITSKGPLGAGIMWLAGGDVTAFGAQPALPYAQSTDAMDEANVVLVNHLFGLMAADAATDLTVDVIGFFLPDPNAYGQKGDRGEKGEKGEKGDRGSDGAQGPQGVQGSDGAEGRQGAQGEVGAQGPKGDKGDVGAQGPQGEKGADGAQGAKGDKGDTGAQGAKGDKGDTGAQGTKGDKGDNGAQGAKGDKGDNGAQGAKGDKGDTGAQGAKGDKGDTGAQGAKGDKGDTGAQGAKGDKGDTGAQGAKGDKGDKGDNGAQGPMGPQGPKGEMPVSITFSSRSYVFPHPGEMSINDSNVTSDSFIIPIYTEVSNGNAIGIASVRNGGFVATGSPNKPFKYIVITPNHN